MVGPKAVDLYRYESRAAVVKGMLRSLIDGFDTAMAAADERTNYFGIDGNISLDF